jgi:hypothetical protein
LSITNVSAEGIGGALGRGTDVTLSSSASATTRGVLFAADARSSSPKAAPPRSESIRPAASHGHGLGHRCPQGALHVDFNADSTGRVAQNAAVINSVKRPVTELDYAGSIRLSGATINANGGSVRFFGQGDALNGRAMGGSSSHSDEQWSPAST